MFQRTVSAALILAPLIAILITSQSISTALALLLVWFPQFVQGSGNDTLLQLLGYEGEICLFGLMLIKTAYCVEQSDASLIMWMVVASARLLSSNTIKRPSEPLFLTKRLLIALFFVCTNAMRIAIIAANSYNDSKPWYSTDDEGSSNLAIYAVTLETVLIGIVAMRSTVSREQPDFLHGYSCVFWIYIYMNLAQLWIADSMSCIVIGVQALGFVLFMPYIEGHVIGEVYPIKNQFMQLLQATQQFMANIHFSACVYIAATGFVIYAADSELFSSLLQFDTRSTICPIHSLVNNQWQTFMNFTRMHPLPYIETNVKYAALTMDNQIDYELLDIGCEGQRISNVPTDSYLSISTIVLGCLPGFLMTVICFPEVEAIVKTSTFWVTSCGLALISMISIQLGDPQNIFIYLLHDSSYSRSYTSAGIGVLLAEIVMIFVALNMWYRRTTHVPKPVSSLSDILANLANWLMAITLAFTIYRMAVSNPITDYGFQPIVRDYSAPVQSNTLSSMIDAHISSLASVYKSGLITELQNKCTNGICVSNNIPLYVNTIVDQLSFNAKSLAITQINAWPDSAVFNDMLLNPPVAMKDMSYLDESIWGKENLSIPTWLIVASTLYGITMISTGFALYKWPYKALEFIDNTITLVLIAGSVSVFFLALQFYLFITNIGYQPFIEWDQVGAALMFASVLGFLTGKFISILHAK